MKPSQSRRASSQSGVSRNAQTWNPSRTKTKRSGASVVSPLRGGGACTVNVGIRFYSQLIPAISRRAQGGAKAAASPAQRAFGGRHFVLGARIDRQRRAQRARQSLEARLGDVVIIRAVQRLDVQGDAGIHGEGLKPLLHQL